MISIIKMYAIKYLRNFLLLIAQDEHKIVAIVIMIMFVFVRLMVVVFLLNIVTIVHVNKVPPNAFRQCLLTTSAKAIIYIAIKGIFVCAKTRCP